MPKTVVIAGAGPAGLTAALEILRASRDYRVIVVEMDDQVGGISKTVNYKGNRIDIGGHRFFSKSDWVMNWWQDILPIECDEGEHHIHYRNKHRAVGVGGRQIRDKEDCLMLRPRLSRIYFLRKFFDYPLKINFSTFRNLGFVRLVKAVFSYLHARAFPVRNERNLRDFIVNRFGQELYETFFRDYTRKVWGVPCEEISAEWGAQRIKGVSVSAIFRNAITLPLRKWVGVGTKNTSLIEQFLYPRKGPGQMWEVVAGRVRDLSGEILLNHKVARVNVESGCIKSVSIRNVDSTAESEVVCDHFISSMPVKNLIGCMGDDVPAEVTKVANGLVYRDFITVGVLLRRFKRSRYSGDDENNSLPDNWIYIQEPDVQVGRLQIFNNWSPHMVADPNTVWVGMEYFCDEDDELWQLTDSQMMALGVSELEQIDLIDRSDVIDTFVLKVPKAYPAYFGSYEQFSVIRKYLDAIENIYPVGRNGMHRYNNQDHSMLTARLAALSIVEGEDRRDEMWKVNVDDDYHEEISER